MQYDVAINKMACRINEWIWRNTLKNIQKKFKINIYTVGKKYYSVPFLWMVPF